MNETAQTFACKLRLEAEVFCEFYMREVEKIEAASLTGNMLSLYERKKVICAGVGSARERILDHCADLDKIAPKETQVINCEITNLVRKEHQNLLKKRGVLRTSPVIALIGYHSEERFTMMNRILDLGGAFSKRLSKNTITHVIASQDSFTSTKASTLRDWNVSVVTSKWLDASEAEGSWASPEQFTVESQESADITANVSNVKEEIHDDEKPDAPPPEEESFLKAVERLCENTQENIDSQGADNLFLSEKTVSTAPRHRKRVSRAVLLNDNQDANQPSSKKQKRVAPGSANTIRKDKVKTVKDTSAERMPRQPSVNTQGPVLPTTGGVESQLVRWDNSASSNVEKKLKEKVMTKIFQLAGGGSVPKARLHTLVKMIQSLHGEVELVPKYVTHSSHLLTLCETQQLTEKYLSFVASGKWVVKEAYITASHEAGVWLDEEEFSSDTPGRPIAHHRANFGGAFKNWKVILLLEPGGISVILRAGGCPEIFTSITPESAEQATHVLADVPNKGLTIDKPKGVSEEALARLASSTFSIEILYRVLCISIDEKAARQHCALTVCYNE
eukprot:TRINITY_DN9239_c2_g1_i1.p1 TRINITY_DN9239_c2_g1~~TRINITY_DN9239_c2_g1_i1.p1  ORF type:complete len:562 (+),score=92.45 TRINITY_DN9239_c2_g1_i1:68-1753(+)